MHGYSFNNNGIGSMYGTFKVPCDEKNENCLLTPADVDKAVGLTEAGLWYAATDMRLLGRLDFVEDNHATVQITGVMRLAWTKEAPFIGGSVILAGDGTVQGTVRQNRSQVIAIDFEKQTCDILL
jgi:hypothetical protein